MAAAAFDYDVIVIGSGFGGSVSALRLTEKGYRVGVLESGRRWNPEDFPKSNWRFRQSLWLPRLGMTGPQRASLLGKCLLFSASGVGGGSLIYGNTLYEPLDAFWTDPHWAHITDWKAELAPYYDQAKRMLGVAPNPRMTPADDVLLDVADRPRRRRHVPHDERRGVLRRAGQDRGRPVLRRRRTGAHRLHPLRPLLHRLPSRREEHHDDQLPLPRRAGRRAGASPDNGHRRPSAEGRRLRARRPNARTAGYASSGAPTPPSRSCSRPRRSARRSCCTS